MEPTKVAADPDSDSQQRPSALDVELLQQLLERRPNRVDPQPGQVVLCTLVVVGGTEVARATAPGLGTVAITHSLVALTPEHKGRQVAVSMLSPENGVLLGLVWQGDGAESQCSDAQVQVDGQRHVIRAEREIELRCGDAAIVLHADGRIQLRGTYISSHASATQRITGGSVNLN